MQISLACIIARGRADHSSIDRSVPAVDLPRLSSAARQGGNDGGRSIRWAYEVKEELVVMPAEFYVQVLKRGKCVVRASGGARVRRFFLSAIKEGLGLVGLGFGGGGQAIGFSIPSQGGGPAGQVFLLLRDVVDLNQEGFSLPLFSLEFDADIHGEFSVNWSHGRDKVLWGDDPQRLSGAPDPDGVALSRKLHVAGDHVGLRVPEDGSGIG